MPGPIIINDSVVHVLVQTSIYPSEHEVAVFTNIKEAEGVFKATRQQALEDYPEATIRDDAPHQFCLDDEGSDVLIHLEIHTQYLNPKIRTS